MSAQNTQLTILKKSQLAPSLTSQEQALLVQEIERAIKQYQTILVFAWLSVLILIGIFMVPATYLALRRFRAKLAVAQDGTLEVYKVTGKLSCRDNGRTRAGIAGLYACYIDGYLVPSQVLSNPATDLSGLLDHAGETVTIEYIPSISRYRAYTDATKHGYNFILDKPF